MNDYKELIVECEKWLSITKRLKADDLTRHIEMCANAIEQLVKERDAEPVKHGHWVIKYIADSDTNEVVCSNCGFGALHYGYGDHNVARTNYCPNCRAKMNEVNNT